MSNCSICGSKNTNKYLTINNYELDLCEYCGLLFTRQNVSSNRIKVNNSIYSNTYLDNYEARDNYLNKRFSKRVNQIENLRHEGNVLDFGCSNGMFLGCFQKNAKYDWKYFGIDINKKSISRAKKLYKNINFKNEHINMNSYNRNFFNIITCFDVLEHDIKINTTVKIFNKILTKEGLLVIQSPNYSSIMAKLCGNNWDWWSVPDHVFHFTPQYMENFLKRNGFKIVRLYTWDPPKEFVYNIIGTYKKYNNNFLGKVIGKLLIPIFYILWFMTIPLKLWFGQGGLILVIAQKNE